MAAAMLGALAVPAQSVEAPPALTGSVTVDQVPTLGTTTGFTNVVPGAKGSDWWYATAWNSLNQPKTVIRIRYSWSWQWHLYNNYDSVSMVIGIACTPMGPLVATACAAYVAANFFVMKSVLASALHARKCIRLQVPAPPLVDHSLWRLIHVTCRV